MVLRPMLLQGCKRQDQGRAFAGQARHGQQGLCLAAPDCRAVVIGHSAEEFLEHHQARAVSGSGFLFHAQGAHHALPRGAIPSTSPMRCIPALAYTCVGCKINGASCLWSPSWPMAMRLRSSCSKAQTPPAAWESIVATGKARAAIRKATREAVRAQYAGPWRADP